MNWHHWYWWTWPAGIAIGVTIICVKNWIVNEIGLRRGRDLPPRGRHPRLQRP